MATIPSTSATPSTLFYTGSTTKAFTAAIASMLVDEDKGSPQLKWDTPLNEVIRDDFVLSNDYATSHVTLEDALSHRSGMPRHDFSYGRQIQSAKDVVRSLRHLPLSRDLRAEFQYCNTMYTAVSHVIETRSGLPLSQMLHQHIWEPLGMRSTCLSLKDAQRSKGDLAKGYRYENGKYHELPFPNLTPMIGAGGVISNVLDYAKWLRSLLNLSGPISAAGHQALRTPRTLIAPQVPPFTGAVSYTLGWISAVYHGHQTFFHQASVDGYGSSVIFFPTLNYGVAVFANTTTARYVCDTLIYQLVDDLLGIPQSDRFDWTKKSVPLQYTRRFTYLSASIRFSSELQVELDQYQTTKARLYPNTPSPPPSTILPLAEYCGTYRHPAYQDMTFTIREGRLEANREDFTWPMTVELEHVYSNFFLARASREAKTLRPPPAAFAAEFRVGANGKPIAFGAVMTSEMEEKIWFERID